MLSFFPLDVLDKIWDVIESVSEGFLTYCCVGRLCYGPSLQWAEFAMGSVSVSVLVDICDQVKQC